MKIKELGAVVEGIIESMSFAAGHKDKEKGYWTSDTDSGSRYGDDFYKNSDKYMCMVMKNHLKILITIQT